MQYYQIYFAVAHLFLFLSPLPHLQCPQNILYPYSPLFCKIPISPLGIADQYTLRTIARESSTEHPQSSTQCSILYQPWVSEQTIKTICFPALNNLFNMKDPDDTIRWIQLSLPTISGESSHVLPCLFLLLLFSLPQWIICLSTQLPSPETAV